MLEDLDQEGMEQVLGNHNEQRQHNGVELIGWIGMIVQMCDELCERAWCRAVHYELICLEGLDAWIGFLDNELFYLRQEMRFIEAQRSNTFDGELGYEC